MFFHGRKMANMKKRNLLFVSVIALLFAAMFLYAPIHSILMANGLIEYENVGNEITVENFYEDDVPLAAVLNGIEEGKRVIKDTYINHLPFYLTVTTKSAEIKRFFNKPIVTLLEKKGNEIVKENRKKKQTPETEPPITEPPVTEPPVTEPPVTEPPVTEPPVTEPPVTEPPVTEPPVTEPPMTEPPVTEPPVTKPPVTEPPVTKPPVTEPPVTKPPVTEPPVTEPPVTEPPVTKPPVTEPPVTEPPVTEPPVIDPPVQRDPVEATYTSEMISKNSQHRFYEVVATYNGSKHPFLFRVPLVPEYDSNPRSAAALMDPQINTLNAMAASEANVNVWLYIASVIEDTELMIDINPSEYKGANLDYFIKHLSDDIWVGHITPIDIAEHNELMYATDHHWNAYGMNRAYQELAAALSEKYPDIVPRQGEEHVTNAYFYGSVSRGINHYTFKDRFVFFDYMLPEHETTVLRCKMKSGRPVSKDPKGQLHYGSGVPCEENYQQYYDGTFEKDDTFDHYVNLYPICDKVVYPGNETGRRALFIGDSFSLGLQELLASHFDETFFFYSDGTVNLFGEQDFADFCEGNGITDVIIIEMSTRILYNYYKDSGPALCSFRVSR